MPRKTVSVLGLRASLFADRSEVGVEFRARRPKKDGCVALEDMQPPHAPPKPDNDTPEALALACAGAP